MSDKRHRLLVLTAAVLGLGVAGSLQAQSLYQQKVEVPTTLEYDSNPALSTSSAGSVSRWRVAPRYTLLRREGADELDLKLGATLEQSSNTALSRNRQNLDGNVQWQHATERSVYVLSAGVTQVALRDALLDETGQLVTDGTRTSRVLAASVQRELTELYTLSGSVNASWNHYSGTTTPDSRQVGASVEFGRALTPGTSVFASANLSNFVPDTPFIANSVMRGVTVGYRSNIPGDPWTWMVSGGGSSYTGPVSDTAAQFAAQAAYQAPRWSASLGFSRGPVTDSLRGTFSPNQQMRAGAEYALTEFTRVGLDLAYNRTRGTLTSATRSVGMRVSTELSPLWRVGFSVRHLQVERSNLFVSTRAASTMASVVLTYSHPDF